MRTQNKNYSLRYDGVIEVEPSQVPKLFMLGVNPEQINVTNISDDVEKFNLRSDIKLELISDDIHEINFDWNLPDEYKNLDIYDYIASKIEHTADERIVDRVVKELSEIKKRGLENLIRTIIYVIDTFKRKQVVWGVGRGSSCASYILYLLGLHCVDPIKYNIPMDEFFHD